MDNTVDTITPGSPGWWLRTLNARLTARRSKFDLLDRYDTGEHPLPEGDERCREMFRLFQRKARSNYTGLVVESTLERMHITGFRTGGDSTTAVDKEAWRIWQANHLDADSDLVHRSMLVMSHAYVIVGANSQDTATPIITPEDPRQVIVDVSPVDRRTVRAGLKTYTDDTVGGQVAVVYLPESIHYFVRKGVGWEILKDPVVNDLGEVPVVRFQNRPRLTVDRGNVVFDSPGVVDEAMSEFAGIIDIQDRVNDTLLNRLVIAKIQAYRQRWAKGLATEDEDGNPLDLPFVPGVDLLWAVEDGDVEFGSFEASDLAPMLKAVEADVRDLAAISRTPPHYLLGEIVNASGDALKAAETGLVAKVVERQRHASESWERVMALAGKYAGHGALQEADTETLWKDPESRTMAELADAAVKKMAAGVPWRQRMEDMGYSPPQIQRMEVERAKEMLMAAPPPQQQALRPASQLQAV